jgi:hypothetical protein
MLQLFWTSDTASRQSSSNSQQPSLTQQCSGHRHREKTLEASSCHKSMRSVPVPLLTRLRVRETQTWLIFALPDGKVAGNLVGYRL